MLYCSLTCQPLKNEIKYKSIAKTDVFFQNTHVLLKKPPMVLPIKRKNCCEKKTRVISCRVDWVWHLRSRMVGPRKATQSPKLKNTIQYVKVCCQLLRNKAQIRSLSRCFILEEVSEVFLQHLHSAIHLRDEKTCPNWESRVQRVNAEWCLTDSRTSCSLKSVLLKDLVKPTP